MFFKDRAEDWEPGLLPWAVPKRDDRDRPEFHLDQLGNSALSSHNRLVILTDLHPRFAARYQIYGANSV